MITRITPGRWHDARGSAAHTLAQKYKKPNTWFRNSMNWYDATFAQEKRKEQYMSAALVFDKRSAVGEFFDSPWTMMVRPERENWVMILSSAESAQAWLARGRDHGALAWYLISDDRPPFEWCATEYPQDDRPERPRTLRSTKFDVDELHSDLRNDALTTPAIAARHGISRMTVHAHKRRLGLVMVKSGRGRPSVLTVEQQHVLNHELATTGLTIRELARKHNVSEHAVMYLGKKAQKSSIK
jgi:hypothetical protein